MSETFIQFVEAKIPRQDIRGTLARGANVAREEEDSIVARKGKERISVKKAWDSTTEEKIQHRKQERRGLIREAHRVVNFGIASH